MKALFGWLAAILNLLATWPYIRDILRGMVKPHAYSWAIWWVLVLITSFNQIQNKGGWSSLFLVSGAVAVTLIFILSLKYGFGNASRLDKVCLALAGVLVVYWITVHDTRLSTLMAVFIDAIGAIPTIIKTYKHPDTETYAPWVISSAATLAALLAVPRLDWVLIIYPIYIFVMNGTIISTKYFGHRKLVAATI
ncbi:MAG: hypothetical protein JWL89_62 [Candidatus Saccharibacteria bacterium]|nr:hypothetical protein [Candidatus Saccharibacteria bacterium]